MSLSSDNQWGTYSPGKKVTVRNRNGFSSLDTVESNPGPSYQRMPNPTGLPWNSQQMPWSAAGGSRGLVEFTAQPLPPAQAHSRNKQMNALHCKRKSNVEGPIPAKQLITDEKMAAHFDGLHISCRYPASTIGYTGENSMVDDNLANCDMEVVNERLVGESNTSFEERVKNAQRVTLCEEMSRIKNEPLLPHSLLQRLEKPCMSLVLWKPPKKNLMLYPETSSDSNNNPNSQNNNYSSSRRTSLLVTDASSMDVEM